MSKQLCTKDVLSQRIYTAHNSTQIHFFFPQKIQLGQLDLAVGINCTMSTPATGPSSAAERDTMPILESEKNEEESSGKDSALYVSEGDAMRGWAILASRF